MSRLEENRAVVEEMAKRSELKPSGTYEEMVVFNLGTIATMLTDISKSLAIIADKAESEVPCFGCADTDNIPKDFEEFTKMMFEQGNKMHFNKEESEDKNE